jgi:hypothetical protein
MLDACDRLEGSLKHGIRGYLILEVRIGDVWIRHLFNLLQVFMRILVLPSESYHVGNVEFPSKHKHGTCVTGTITGSFMVHSKHLVNLPYKLRLFKCGTLIV